MAVCHLGTGGVAGHERRLLLHRTNTVDPRQCNVSGNEWAVPCSYLTSYSNSCCCCPANVTPQAKTTTITSSNTAHTCSATVARIHADCPVARQTKGVVEATSNPSLTVGWRLRQQKAQVTSAQAGERLLVVDRQRCPATATAATARAAGGVVAAPTAPTTTTAAPAPPAASSSRVFAAHLEGEQLGSVDGLLLKEAQVFEVGRW